LVYNSDIWSSGPLLEVARKLPNIGFFQGSNRDGHRQKNGHLASTLLKGLDLLELIAARNEISVSEATQLTSQSRTACHRLLATLEAAKYVYKTDERRYRISMKLLNLAGQVNREIPIMQAAKPYLQFISAKFRETVNLGYWDGGKIIHLDKVESNEILTSDPRIGSEAMGHCTALGKVFFAFLDQSAREALLDRYQFTALTPNTITSRMEFMEELAKIREQGYALDEEELSLGLRCVAAPIFDSSNQIIGSLSISAPAARLNPTVQEKAIIALRNAAKKLSKDLGAQESYLADK
jgi:DNA-binding IclR family transcriptional regulator